MALSSGDKHSICDDLWMYDSLSIYLVLSSKLHACLMERLDVIADIPALRGRPTVHAIQSCLLQGGHVLHHTQRGTLLRGSRQQLPAIRMHLTGSLKCSVEVRPNVSVPKGLFLGLGQLPGARIATLPSDSRLDDKRCKHASHRQSPM